MAMKIHNLAFLKFLNHGMFYVYVYNKSINKIKILIDRIHAYMIRELKKSNQE